MFLGETIYSIVMQFTFQQKKIFLIVAAVAILLCAIVWVWQRPSVVVKSALLKANQAETHVFKAIIDIQNNQATTALLGEEGKVRLELDGVFQEAADKNSSLQSQVTMNLQTDSVTLQLAGEVRFIEDKAYLLINKSPAVFPALAKLKGTWIELPRGAHEQIEENQPITGELFSSVKYEGREKRDGQTVLHYGTMATQVAIVRMMDSIAQLLGTQLTEQQLTSLRDGMAQVKEVPVEVWVTPFAHELQGIKATLAVPGGNTLQFELLLKDRNKAVQISKPENALTADKAFSPTAQ